MPPSHPYPALLVGILRPVAVVALRTAARRRIAAPAVLAVALLAGQSVLAATAPGAAPYPPELAERLRTAAAAETGPPRTRHRDPSGAPLYTNRLVLEPSPYLQQHAHNPVDWYPWGDEAFARARSDGKPVLLSVGYSTCHWCHVMEEESFEDPEIAEYLNRNYITVKVDRERRPDVDGVYMQAVQLMGERGGWPMTVWLTPDRQPFYGGSYFPPHDGDRGQSVGFLTLLHKLRDAYAARPSEVAAAAADLTRQVRASFAAPADATLPGRAALDRAVAALRAQYDAENGGFGGAPKFPRPAQLELLLRYARRTGDADVRRMAERTLEAMAAGGIHDQIGGGFHRYATDARWQVPHFEKMLYDNALLATVYLEAAQAGARADFAAVTRDVLDYVRRDMTAPTGAFYSASDADSDGGEGTYFVWTPSQLAAALEPDDRPLLAAYYGVTPVGNFHGATILHVAQPFPTVARTLGLEPGVARERLERGRRALLTARQTRVPPHTDRKIVPAWNGLMISAFARAGAALNEPEYVAAANRAATYVLDSMRHGERLHRSALDGRASGDGYLDDYAFVIGGLLDLHEATGGAGWLRDAIGLERVVDTHFRDPTAGGYFLTADDAEALLAREKPSYDGAEPSGNSVMVTNLLRLAELTGDDRYRTRAAAALRALAPVLAQDPLAMPALLNGLERSLDRSKEIVIVAPHDRSEAEPFLDRLRPMYVPNRVVIATTAETVSDTAQLLPLVADKTARGGLPTAYVCEQRICALPTNDPAVFAKQLARVEPLP